eukprot:CAMPEP_0197035332 /NCGR_PEP_ID=MMETSP1384-20130603/13169_1 /TAXON_ID=29189 /ORGANISM="Ammonia sp." /LENGTH=292 /DNA_ID=CAMNT_0042465381 /DNA_START=33 /DNA_END=911 /DNA_ORIENTATION=+
MAATDSTLFGDELVLQSLYDPQQITVNLVQGQCLVEFTHHITEHYIILAKFTKTKDAAIHISISNHAKCSERFHRKSLEKIQAKLDEICIEESDSNPIFQCISYLTDSLIDDLPSMDIELVQQGKKKQEAQNPEPEEKKAEHDTNDNQHKYRQKHKKKNGKQMKADDQQNEVTKPKQLVTIYTWGNKIRKKAPIDSQHNTNVCGVVGYKPHGVDLKHLNGKDARIQEHVAKGKNYDLYANNLKHKIVNEGLRTISINCHKGRHRSVAFAELLAKDLRNTHGYQVKVVHLEIS